MTFVLTSDHLLSSGEVQSLLGVKDGQQAIIMANSLASKFLRFTNRCQINQSTTADIVEKIRPYGGQRLWLHAPVWQGQGYTVEAKIYEGVTLLQTYTAALGDFSIYTSDFASYLELCWMGWPELGTPGHIQVTYKGGWAAIPGDVIQGAIMQGRVDLLRMNGEVGVNSRGSQGESTSYQTAGIIKEVADLWAPYRMVA